MTDIYFGIKLILAAFILGFMVVLIPLILMVIWIDNIRYKRIAKHLESIGCERYLISTAAWGNNHTWGWKREEPFLLIRDSELRDMKLKEIKRKYE